VFDGFDGLMGWLCRDERAFLVLVFMGHALIWLF
jgi:hypothetical protein